MHINNTRQGQGLLSIFSTGSTEVSLAKGHDHRPAPVHADDQ